MIISLINFFILNHEGNYNPSQLQNLYLYFYKENKKEELEEITLKRKLSSVKKKLYTFFSF